MDKIISSTHRSLAKKQDKTLWENEWLAVKEHDGWYTYMHQKKCDGKAVAVLGYSESPLSPLGRFERVPCHNDGVSLCALTGMVDGGEDFKTAAAREFEEESGVKVDEKELEDLGEIRPSKASDTVVHLYAVKIPKRDGKLTGKGDGTKGEQGAFCSFVSVNDSINSKDPLLATMVVRLLEKLGGLEY